MSGKYRRDPPSPKPSPQIQEQIFLRTFDPDDEDDRKEMCRIKNMAIREQAFIYKEVPNYNDKQGRYHIYLEWSEVTIKDPETYQEEIDDEDFTPQTTRPFYDAEDIELLNNEDREDE